MRCWSMCREYSHPGQGRASWENRNLGGTFGAFILCESARGLVIAVGGTARTLRGEWQMKNLYIWHSARTFAYALICIRGTTHDTFKI
jgi:hypothetical protein